MSLDTVLARIQVLAPQATPVTTAAWAVQIEHLFTTNPSGDSSP